ncbi:MAG: DUF3738 domain-containing protein [Arcicella sp.]|nr:DUF3738 domain-containing protein [Arcicella sp.]
MIDFSKDFCVFAFGYYVNQGSQYSVKIFLNEQYGNSITIDETGLKGKYDHILDWQKRTELLEELKKIGLTLEKTQRPVEMLVIADE